VKTTRQLAATDAAVFLSRNEASAGSRDYHWRLVVCRNAVPDDVAILGSCAYHTIAPLLPSNTDRGAWVSCRLDLSIDVLDPDLAFLEGVSA
jgi:hypothetical protein